MGGEAQRKSTGVSVGPPRVLAHEAPLVGAGCDRRVGGGLIDEHCVASRAPKAHSRVRCREAPMRLAPSSVAGDSVVGVGGDPRRCKRVILADPDRAVPPVDQKPERMLLGELDKVRQRAANAEGSIQLPVARQSVRLSPLSQKLRFARYRLLLQLLLLRLLLLPPLLGMVMIDGDVSDGRVVVLFVIVVTGVPTLVGHIFLELAEHSVNIGNTPYGLRDHGVEQYDAPIRLQADVR
mmetsp:Transcript_92423/g.266842  ORF Transcript_92423/g.266842 Transcript_92423/m.266842 type:complete len:237 (-) Transcript_92423:406-1116(-)